MKRAFLTTTRDDLFAICRIMARAVDPEFLFDAKAPLNFYVNGTSNSGKKIVSDVFYEEVLREETGRSGNKGYDEYVSGTVSGKSVDLNYIDLFWHSSFYSEQNLHSGNSGTSHTENDQRQHSFADTRQNGGINIFQNAFKPQEPGVEIWMEKYAQSTNMPLRSHTSKLGKAFAKAAEKPDSGWSRYVEVEINDPRLLNSSRFMKSLDKLASRIGKFDKFEQADQKQSTPKPKGMNL